MLETTSQDSSQWTCRFCGHSASGLGNHRVHIINKHPEKLEAAGASCTCKTVCKKCVPDSLLDANAPLPSISEPMTPAQVKEKRRAAERKRRATKQGDNEMTPSPCQGPTKRARKVDEAQSKACPEVDDDANDDDANPRQLFDDLSKFEGFYVEQDESKRFAAARRLLLDEGKDAALILSSLSTLDGDDDVRTRFLENLHHAPRPGELASLSNSTPEPIKVSLQGCKSSATGKGDLQPLHLAYLADMLPPLGAGADADFGVILVVGSSGSGVTRLLRRLQNFYNIPEGPSVSFYGDEAVASTLQNPRDSLPRVGLNDINAWCRAYHSLSNGQRQRVRLARLLESNALGGLVIDDLGAAVDEADARAIAQSLGRFFRGQGGEAPLRRVLIGTHVDITNYLQPDLVLQLGEGGTLTLHKNPVAMKDRKASLKIHMPQGEQPAAASSHSRSLSRHASNGGEEELEMEECEWTELTSSVRIDEKVEMATAAFEVDFNGRCSCEVPQLDEKWIRGFGGTANGPQRHRGQWCGGAVTGAGRLRKLGDSWKIGLVVGPSGSGKTTALKRILPRGDTCACSATGNSCEEPWDQTEPVIAQVCDDQGKAQELLEMVRLPLEARARCFGSLSASEQAVAEIARSLGRAVGGYAPGNEMPIVLVDEFTTNMDRPSARRLCHSLKEWMKQAPCRLVLATVYEDVAGWLAPGLSWAFLTHKGRVIVNPKPSDYEPAALPPEPTFTPPQLEVQVENVDSVDEKHRLWEEHFKVYHYLSGDLQAGHCDAFLARDVATRSPVAFLAVHKVPGKQHCKCHLGHKFMWMEHRLVVKPSWQCFGLGTGLSETVGRLILERGEKYVSKTAHPRLIASRESKSCWARHGQFTATVETLRVRGGAVELIGPPANMGNYANKVMVHALRIDAGGPDDTQLTAFVAKLIGRAFKVTTVSGGQACYMLKLGALAADDLNDLHVAVQGEVVFYRPALSPMQPPKNTVKNVGSKRLSLECRKEGALPVALLKEKGQKQQRIDLTAFGGPGTHEPDEKVNAAFRAISELVYMAGSPSAESANLKEACRRLARGDEELPVPFTAKRARLGNGEGMAIKSAGIIRVTFSHELMQ